VRPFDVRKTALATLITRQHLYERLLGHHRPVLIEALGSGFYADAHLPGALNISPGEADALAPALVPDRDAAIVVYCSASCTNAEAVARRLEEVGYRDVAIYTGGKEEWAEHGLPLERPSDDPPC
jgi:rhodanese-related sulfurtransferase